LQWPVPRICHYNQVPTDHCQQIGKSILSLATYNRRKKGRLNAVKTENREI
jgi:hypothetical protein